MSLFFYFHSCSLFYKILNIVLQGNLYSAHQEATSLILQLGVLNHTIASGAFLLMLMLNTMLLLCYSPLPKWPTSGNRSSYTAEPECWIECPVLCVVFSRCRETPIGIPHASICCHFLPLDCPNTGTRV